VSESWLRERPQLILLTRRSSYLLLFLSQTQLKYYYIIKSELQQIRSHAAAQIAAATPCQSYICCDAEVQFVSPSFAAPLPGLRNELRPLPESRFGHREKLPAPSLNNRKFITKSILKKNEPVPSGVALSELSNSTKKHTSKSHETIPLKTVLRLFAFLYCTGNIFVMPFRKQNSV
jgi:hypothetical protein